MWWVWVGWRRVGEVLFLVWRLGAAYRWRVGAVLWRVGKLAPVGRELGKRLCLVQALTLAGQWRGRKAWCLIRSLTLARQWRGRKAWCLIRALALAGQRRCWKVWCLTQALTCWKTLLVQTLNRRRLRLASLIHIRPRRRRQTHRRPHRQSRVNRPRHQRRAAPDMVHLGLRDGTPRGLRLARQLGRRRRGQRRDERVG